MADFQAQARVINDILLERKRQEWLKAEGRFQYTPADPQLDDGERLAILVEEIGEIAKAIQYGAGLRDELIQVAAVCAAWVEFLDKENRQ